MLGRIVGVGAIKAIIGGTRRLVRRRMLVAGVLMVLALLIASLRGAGQTQVVNPTASGQPSFASQVYRDLSSRLAAIGTWVASYVRSERGAAGTPSQPVTAYLTPPFIDAPSNLSVTSATSSTISLSWSAPAGGANHYLIERSENVSGPFSQVTSVTGTTHNDSTVINQHAYLYRVRAVSSSGMVSTPSNMALGTAISFEFTSLQGQEIKAQHFYDVRTAINLVRAIANRPAFSWARGTLGGLEVKADDVNEMRTALDQALSDLSIPLSAYQDTPLSVGANGTLIQAIHIEQLQSRSTRGSSTSSGPFTNDSSTARLDPLNRTGGNGENPLSRNFAWTVPLVSLPGRAGLDLGLSLSYNSLVWTKNIATSTITFDDDHGSPSPGFRLGFAVIQGPYFNSLAGKNAYLLITPSGDRIEFREVDTPGLFESADASYMTLQVNADNTITVRTTDGTQLSYQQIGSDYQCTKIKDRNGNYISINYVSGRLDTVVDTLSRTIKFNYDGGFPTTITQVWNQGTANEVTHEWASFTYNPTLPIHTSFSGVTSLGPQNGAELKVLSSVSVNNGTARFDFAYTSWGQVWKISQKSAGGDLLNYRAYDLPLDDSTVLTDCPRFTERRDWAQSWNGDVDGVPATAEVAVTSFSGPANTSLPDGSLQTVTRATVTLPNGTYHQIYYAGTIEGTAGSAPAWQRGLPLVTETFGRSNPSSSIIRQRSVAKTWTQDDENLSYSLNPRMTETNVSDFNNAGQVQNRSRTRMSYRDLTFTDGRRYSFPENVYEYRTDLTTVLRRTYTDYNLTTTYTNPHIMGLVKEGSLYEVDPNTLAEKLMSKVTFDYDGAGSIQATGSLVQHDPAYDTTLVAGRGNLSKETRYDTSPGSQAIATASMFYNIAGSLVKTTDFADHQTLISYTDKFAADGINLDAARPSTLAYPTMVTDADGYVTRYRYHYDLGVLTWRKTPEPNTTALNTNDSDPGPEQTFSYDDVGRVKRVTNLTNSAYTRYVYPGTQAGSLNRVDTYRTIVDGATEQNGNEAHSLQVFDGHGRLIGSASSNPGSSGGFRGQHIIYDNLGRMFKTSNATETSASGVPSAWAATGDDQQDGFRYMQQTYDWKGRPLVTTNTDNTTKVVSYAGCGCAGGEVVTITDEGTIYNLEVKKRQQKIYSDVLGRNYKTEILNWDGTGPNGTDGTVYATLINTFNARDQVTVSRVYQGTESSNVFQETVNNYDGYGRLSSQKKPEQLSATTFSYYADDSLHVITDARGATTTFTYNGRQKILSITYGGGYSAPAVTFQYDAVGNRTQMADGMGTVDYHYDQLSRLTSEDRYLTSLNQTFTLSYGYNLADQMTTLSEPAQFGSTVINVYDKAGQITEVNGSGGGASQYAHNIQYRAWGGLKHLDYGNSLKLDLTYNNRLQVTQYDLKTASGTRVMGQQYQYQDDGRVKKSTDLVNGNLNREYGYDNAGRLLFGITTPNGPYEQTYLYDVWGNMTFRSWRTFAFNSFCNCNYPQFNSANYTYSNNKNTASGWSYDADGRLLTSVEGSSNFSYTYDAAGRQLTANQPGKSISQSYDGDGERTKWVENGATTYYIRSSALGGSVITELDQSGGKRRGYVYAGGQEIAKQENGQVFWDHRDVSGVSMRTTNSAGTVTSRTETDPLGTVVDDTAAYNSNGGGNGYSFSPTGFYGNPTMPNMGCTLDGVMADCNHVQRLLNIGATVQCPAGGCGPQASFNPATGRNELYHFNPNAAAVGIGTLGVGRGFLPAGIDYVGNGFTVAPGAGAIVSGMGTMVDIPTSSRAAFYTLDQIEILVPQSGGQGGGGRSSPQSPPQHPLKEDIGAARAKIENDKWCREALNELLAAVVPAAAMVDNQKYAKGKWTSVDMYDAFDRLSKTTVDRTDKSGVTKDGSVETINDLSVDLGGGTLYVNNGYATRTRDEKIFALIHESLHMFAGYTDQALALAAKKLSGETNPKPYPSTAEGRKAASLALNEYIGRKCKDLSNKGTTIRFGD